MEPPWTERAGIVVDRHADVPLGVQLAWALARAIRAGRLGPGDRLPPLRELAGELGVNPNTLRSVYARLESEGMIETHHGRGTFVTQATGPRGLDDLVATAARAARDAGLDPRELAAALYVSPDAASPRDAEAARRRSLRDEIAVLERVLSGLRVEPAPPAGRSGGPQLLSLAELEAARDQLVARIGAASRPPAKPPAEPAPAVKTKKAAAARRAPRLGPATA